MGIAQDPLRNGILSVATDRHIVELLVRMRMGVRRKRRDFGFYERLGKTKKPHRITPVATILATLLPPRNEWPRPAAKTRQAASIKGKDATAQLLVRWILSRWGTPRTESPDWLMELRRFSGRIRHRLATWDAAAELASPETFIKLKTFAKEKGEPDEYRGLAVYSVEDRLVVSLAARYWRLRTDDLMHSGSVAFRTAVPPKTHHSAVSEILAFRRSLMKLGVDEIWVSEVDIRGFFDVISIAAARRAVEKLAARLPPELKPDIRAVGILNAFLESYSFNKVGQPQAIELAKHKKRVGFEIAVPWPEAQLKALGVDTLTESVGIPQGGALSCFLANAVLDQADQAVQAVVTAAGQDQHALYLRYCDDIICLATSEGLCRGMMEAYKRAVESLRLPIHPILEFKTRYVDDVESKNKKTFWDGKSKAPYRWGPAGQVQWVPWCSFVGYQIRHDGYLRVRPKSIKKEVEKQNLIEHKIKRDLQKHGQRRTKRQVLYRLRQRLRSIAVGVGPRGWAAGVVSLCWAHGFHLLKGQAAATNPLRDLDRHRIAKISAITRVLGTVKAKEGINRTAATLKFEGFPYSYAGLVEHNVNSGRRRTNSVVRDLGASGATTLP